jgi:hypothetical protein
LKFSTKNEDPIETKTVVTKGAACLDSNRFWMTPLPPEESSQTVSKGGPLPSPAVHYTQQQKRQRLLLRVFLHSVLPTLSKRFRPRWLALATKKNIKFFSSVGVLGIQDVYPRSQIQQLQNEEGEKFVVLFLFVAVNLT